MNRATCDCLLTEASSGSARGKELQRQQIACEPGCSGAPFHPYGLAGCGEGAVEVGERSARVVVAMRGGRAAENFRPRTARRSTVGRVRESGSSARAVLQSVGERS